MKKQNTIENTLKSALNSLVLKVENESHKHQVPKNSETHFKVLIVSDAFQNKKLLERHQMIYKILDQIMPEIHALSILAYTPEEYDVKQTHLASTPPCQR